jgi:transposase
MARAYSQDLRDRVIDAALKGMSARQAAARFGIGDATAIVWVRRARQSGERRAHKQGQPRRSKLDPHREFLLAAIEATPDLTISELLERLLSERGVKAARATLWTFLDRCGLTFKKRMARPVCKQFYRERRLIGLRQRIRPRGEPLAKMEIRAFRPS